MRNTILAVLLLLVNFFSCKAQEVILPMPAAADLSRPRTMLGENTLHDIHLRLPQNYEIFQGVYNDAQRPIPPGNTELNQRRGRSTLAKNAAFVLYLNKATAGGEIITLPDTVKQELVQKTILLLNTLNPDPGVISLTNPTIYLDYQWRSRELINYLSAYDLLLAAGVPDTLSLAKKSLQTFAANFYTETTKSLFGYSFFSTIKNNHALMTSAAMGMAGGVLYGSGDSLLDKQCAQWLHTSLYNINNLMWDDEERLSGRTGISGFAEGPYYAKYSLQNMLPFFRMMGKAFSDTSHTYTFSGKSASIQNPYYDAGYDSLYSWLSTIMLPDATLPPLGDTYVNMSAPELMLAREAKWYKKPKHLGGQLNITNDLRAEFLAAYRPVEEAAQPGFFASRESGNIIYRPTGSDSLYFHITARSGKNLTSGGGHNQGDNTSFMLWAKGRHLALDPGYLSYDMREEVGRPQHHNLILINDKGPAMGTAGNSATEPATITDWAQMPGFSYAAIASAYQGANVKRQFFFLEDEKILIADNISSEKNFTSTWQLHGNDLPQNIAFQHNTATFNAGNTVLSAFVVAAPIPDAATVETSYHEKNYKAAPHGVLRVKNSGKKTAFLSLLNINNDNHGEITGADGNIAVAGFSVGGQQHLTLANPEGAWQQMKLGKFDISTDAEVVILRLDGTGNWKSLALVEATAFSLNNVHIVNSNTRATIFLERLEAGTTGVYVDRPADIRLQIPGEKLEVSENDSLLWLYNDSLSEINITVPAKRYFNVVPVKQQPTGFRQKSSQKLVLQQVASGIRITLPEGANAPDYNVQILDLTGRIVMEKREIFSGQPQLLNLTKQAQGIYVVRVSAEKEHYAGKIFLN